MVLAATYVAAAIVLAPLIFVAAEWVGHNHTSRPRHRLFYSILAAALWPLLLLGLAQFAVIVAIRHFAVTHSAGPVLDLLGEDADTAKLPCLAGSFPRVGTPAL
ncbi:MAG: hypothetical protein KIH64_008725 [Mycobacterium sp.]|nr:hypothetical protein [Mycobacterium sp.]